jgi:hypothetical protein
MLIRLSDPNQVCGKVRHKMGVDLKITKVIAISTLVIETSLKNDGHLNIGYKK